MTFASTLATNILGLFVGFLLAYWPLRLLFRWYKRPTALLQGPFLFVTAHPDDECMFFTPTIRHCLRQKSDNSNGHVFIACLTNGNYDGLGRQRETEFAKSCRCLGIPASNQYLLSHPQVKDGPNEKWSQNIVHDFLEPLIKRNNIRTIITFDGYGVSGHRNHISAHHSVSLLLKMNGPVKFIYSLQSVPLWRKFISAADLPICLLLHKSDEILVAGDWGDFLAGYRAMLEHQTQLIWFRRLYILFSRYMLINSLQLTATLVAK